MDDYANTNTPERRGRVSCTGELEVTQLAPNRFRLEGGAFLMFDGGLHDITKADLQDDGSARSIGRPYGWMDGWIHPPLSTVLRGLSVFCPLTVP